MFWINYTGRRDEYPLPDTNRGRLNQIKTMTANKGAAEIRSKILRKMKELEHQNSQFGWNPNWMKLREYIKGMAKRASAKKGGLGHK